MRKLIWGLFLLILVWFGGVWWDNSVYAASCDCGMELTEGGWVCDSRGCHWEYGGWTCKTCSSLFYSCGPGTYACNRGCCDIYICDANAWGACDEPCGPGTQVNDCGDTRSCNEGPCCNPNSWGACTPSCGPGTQWNDCGDTRYCNLGPCCTVTTPGSPVLISPPNGSKQPGLTVNLDWNGVSFGTGCPSNNNQYLVYAEPGDSTPDVLVATVDGATTSYTLATEKSKKYYWQVVASNGSQTAISQIRSFYTPGLVTGTLFDASAVDNCATMALEPKISGAAVDITGLKSYAPVTDVLGIYSQIVEAPDSYTVSPAVGDPYSPTPKLTCQGTSADFVVGGSGAKTLDFGFWRIYGGWWQVIGGDVYGGGGIESIVPVSMPADSRYLIKNDASGNGGLAQYETGGIVLEYGTPYSVQAEVSEKGWEAESGYGGQEINYAYYMAKMRILDKTAWDGVGKPAYNPIDGYEIYTHTGNVTINFSVDGGEKRIFMIDGNVLVNSNVTVALGSHLAVIASGTITFADNVGEAHGWWVGDRIVIESTGDTATDVQFKGQGSFVGWSKIEFNRDRGVTNNSEPAEEFTYRPDLMVNAPAALKFSRYKWLEQVP